MEITLNNKKVALIEPEHVEKKFLQETKFMIKNLPDIIANTETFFGVGAAASALFIPMDNVSKLILGSFAAASIISGVVTNELKIHYNKPQSRNLFETEFRAYVEDFGKRRFKQIYKLEKTKRSKPKQKNELEERQKFLLQDMAKYLLGYVDEISTEINRINKIKDKVIFDRQYSDEEYFEAVKMNAAKLRSLLDQDLFYLLKFFGDNLDAFEVCEDTTKKKIVQSMIEYGKYLINNSVINAKLRQEFREKMFEISTSSNMEMQKGSERWKICSDLQLALDNEPQLFSFGKIKMEEEEAAKKIFEDFELPSEYCIEIDEVNKLVEKLDHYLESINKDSKLEDSNNQNFDQDETIDIDMENYISGTTYGDERLQ